MLRYKAARRQAVYADVDERWSSRVCSACGGTPPKRLRGIADLGIRRWECSDCGALHDRDANAAMNIIRAGLDIGLPLGKSPYFRAVNILKRPLDYARPALDASLAQHYDFAYSFRLL
jgi:transposase